MKKIVLTALILAVLGAGSLFAATSSASHDVTITVSEVVLMELNSTAAISLTTVSPGVGNAGDDVTGQTDSSKRLIYTSLVANSTTRKITAALDANLTQPGVALTLTAVAPGGATEGSSAGTKTLTTVAEDIITTIGSCATGNTDGTDGAALTYALSVTNVDALEVDAVGETVTVTLTLTDAS